MGQIAVRISDKLDNRLKRLAKKTHRTKTFYVREAILHHMDELEETYLAEKALSKFEAGAQETISLEDLEKELGLEN